MSDEMPMMKINVDEQLYREIMTYLNGREGIKTISKIPDIDEVLRDDLYDVSEKILERVKWLLL